MMSMMDAVMAKNPEAFGPYGGKVEMDDSKNMVRRAHETSARGAAVQSPATNTTTGSSFRRAFD